MLTATETQAIRQTAAKEKIEEKRIVFPLSWAS